MPSVMKDLTGRRFDKLVVLKRVENVNPPKWLCKCDCDNECIVISAHLKSGHTKSCGCLRSVKQIKDLSGQRFGKLIVNYLINKSELDVNKKSIYWSCLCDCGTSVIVKSSYLLSGHTKSCGCFKIESFNKLITKHGLYYNRVYRVWKEAKRRAKRQQIPFDLEFQDMPEVPKFCPILGIELKLEKDVPTDYSPSIDRIIPELGYVKDNVKIISYRANRIKNNGTAEEHIKVAEYIIRNRSEI